MPCYYCGEAFQPKDVVVELDLATMQAGEDGGAYLGEQRTEYAHQHCLGSPE